MHSSPGRVGGAAGNRRADPPADFAWRRSGRQPARPALRRHHHRLVAWGIGAATGAFAPTPRAGLLDLAIGAFIVFSLASTLWSDYIAEATTKIVFFYIPFALLYWLVRQWWTVVAEPTRARLNSLQAKGIPCLEPSFPFGNFDGVGTKIHIVERHRRFMRLSRKIKIAGNYSLLKRLLVLLDLDLIKNVCIRDFDSFMDRGVYYNEVSDPAPALFVRIVKLLRCSWSINLIPLRFGLEGAEWRYIRNKMSPTFTSGKIKHMYHTIVDINKELIMSSTQGKEMEIRDMCLNIHLRYHWQCRFWTRLCSIQDRESVQHPSGTLHLHQQVLSLQ